jgi:hypothetical protein
MQLNVDDSVIRAMGMAKVFKASTRSALCMLAAEGPPHTCMQPLPRQTNALLRPAASCRSTPSG